MEKIETIDSFFTNDEINSGISKFIENKDYKIKLIKELYDPGTTDNGKRETLKKYWEIIRNNKTIYYLEYLTEDSHYTDERGKDYYETRLLNENQELLFDSLHTHINVPLAFSEDNEYSARYVEKTSLYSEDTLAKTLFNKLKKHNINKNIKTYIQRQ